MKSLRPPQPRSRLLSPTNGTSRTAVRNVRAILPNRVLDDATLVAEDGMLVSIVQRGTAPPEALDGRGAFCLAGIVDTHCDGLEKEAQPRPGVPFPYDFALASFEGRVRAAGVTTIFHGVAFENEATETRTVEMAEQMCGVIDERCASDPLLDHRILHRLDGRDPAGFDALRKRLLDQPDAAAGDDDDSNRVRPLVSFEDHTPGQGQYADPAVYSTYLKHKHGMTRAEADEAVAQLTLSRDARLNQRASAIEWMEEAAGQGQIRLLAHDPANARDIDEARQWGAEVAEFPTTVEAAEAARNTGLATVMGAPNALRGGSHSGNVSAEELIGQGLCTALASDYLPSTLLAAAFCLAERGTVGLPDAVALITSGPASVAGLDDRGALTVGNRADVVVATLDGGWPTVRAVFC